MRFEAGMGTATPPKREKVEAPVLPRLDGTLVRFFKDSLREAPSSGGKNRLSAFGASFESDWTLQDIDAMDDGAVAKLLREKKVPSGQSLYDYLHHNFRDKIQEAFDFIDGELREGKRPTVTIPVVYVASILKDGLRKREGTDRMKKITGQVGQEDLYEEQERMVVELDVPADDIIPRSTGRDEIKGKKFFNYKGTVVFRKDIDPSHVRIIRVPTEEDMPDRTNGVSVTPEVEEIIKVLREQLVLNQFVVASDACVETGVC